jgi:hypothetical protein
MGFATEGLEFKAPVGSKIFSSSFRQAVGPTQAHNQWVLGTISLRVKQLGHEADYSSSVLMA